MTTELQQKYKAALRTMFDAAVANLTPEKTIETTLGVLNKAQEANQTDLKIVQKMIQESDRKITEVCVMRDVFKATGQLNMDRLFACTLPDNFEQGISAAEMQRTIQDAEDITYLFNILKAAKSDDKA